MQVENRASKKADLHVTNNNKLVLQSLAAKNSLYFSDLCIASFL